MTTKAIKRGQYEPAEVEKIGPNSWAVLSGSTDERYAVTRRTLKLSVNGKPLRVIRWKCGCRATTVACRHIVSVIVREMRAKGWIAAFWTSWHETRRQRRKTWAMESNEQTFWVTGRPARDVQRPHKRGRFVGVTTDIHGIKDAHWVVQGFPGRYPIME